MLNRFRSMVSLSRKSSVLALAALLVGSITACSPRVEVAMSDKPIEININAKIDHEVRVRVERDVEQLVTEQKGLF